MAATQLATQIDEDVKRTLAEVCRQRGWKLNKFIEDAIIDKLEEIEDAEDIRSLRKEPARPLRDVLKDLKANGKI